MADVIARPVDVEVASVLAQLEAGVAPRDLETEAVDVKEEAGRRHRGVIQAGGAQNEVAAQKLAPEVACMASTPGGGALIVGVADDGARIGTELDRTWLRHRLYELLEGKTTPEIAEHTMTDGTRVLIISVFEAMEPVLFDHKLRWRVDAHCVPVTINEWWSRHPAGLRVDPTAVVTADRTDTVRSGAISLARDWLEIAGLHDLAQAPDRDLLTRLGVAEGDYLTVAGQLAFGASATTPIDYIRRDHRGGSSTLRIDDSGTSTLEVLDRVLTAIQDANRVVLHHPAGTAGVVRRQILALPTNATREVIVNALTHRDWHQHDPVVVEHIGDTLIVTSPGGFVGGVNEKNILTKVSARNGALRNLFQKLGLAEREGVGIDRMTAELVAIGRPRPVIHEEPGPAVRVELIGGPPDEEWINCLDHLDPPLAPTDVDAHLILDQITRAGWMDARSAAPLLQSSLAIAAGEMERVATITVDGKPVLARVEGTPASDPPAWSPSAALRSLVPSRSKRVADPSTREHLALGWAQHRGRVSTTELGAIVGISASKTSSTLQDLEARGLLAPSRPQRVGKGFFYKPTRQTT